MGPQSFHERNVPSSKMASQDSAKMVQAGFAGAVCICFQRGDPDSINAPNIDDPRRVVWPRSFLKQRCHKTGEIEDAVEVQREHPGPGGGRVFIVRSSPVGAGVVDKHMKL